MISTGMGLELARVHGRDTEGRPLVARRSTDGTPARLEPARLAVDLTVADFEALAADGAEVLLARPDAEALPLIVGVVRDRPRAAGDVPAEIVLEARERIVIRCGTGRIVLFGDGRIEVLGERVSQRSRGVHSIKGAAVRIN